MSSDCRLALRDVEKCCQKLLIWENLLGFCLLAEASWKFISCAALVYPTSLRRVLFISFSMFWKKDVGFSLLVPYLLVHYKIFSLFLIFCWLSCMLIAGTQDASWAKSYISHWRYFRLFAALLLHFYVLLRVLKRQVDMDMTQYSIKHIKFT